VSEPRATAPPRHRMDPIERMVARVLGIGIGISLALMLAGVALSIARGQALPSHVVRLGDLASQLVALDPAAYLSLGLVTLIATPFVRVAGSLVAFARERDRRYVLITAVVLAVMCVSVLLGRA
jgi:uncharacterized membrane protein